MSNNYEGLNNKTYYKYIKENKKNIELLKKNNRKALVFIVILSFIFIGTSSIASYSIAANNISFTAKDNHWVIDNTKDAIDDLRKDIGASLVGSIFSYMGINPPEGYLTCDGTEYNIEDYPRLAEHLKNNFGSYNFFGGDGTATFKVPDLRGEFLRGSGTNSTTSLSGANVGNHQDQGLPNITGTFKNINHITRVSANGALSVTTSYESSGTTGGSNFRNRGPVTHIFDASKSNPIYGNGSNVVPSNTAVLYIIKY